MHTTFENIYRTRSDRNKLPARKERDLEARTKRVRICGHGLYIILRRVYQIPTFCQKALNFQSKFSSRYLYIDLPKFLPRTKGSPGKLSGPRKKEHISTSALLKYADHYGLVNPFNFKYETLF